MDRYSVTDEGDIHVRTGTTRVLKFTWPRYVYNAEEATAAAKGLVECANAAWPGRQRVEIGKTAGLAHTRIDGLEERLEKLEGATAKISEGAASADHWLVQGVKRTRELLERADAEDLVGVVTKYGTGDLVPLCLECALLPGTDQPYEPIEKDDPEAREVCGRCEELLTEPEAGLSPGG